MKFFGKLFISVVSNLVAIMASAYFVQGFIFEGDFIDLIITAAIFTIINLLLRPILKLLFGPLVILTMGLFIIVINSLTVYILDIISESLTIQGYLPLLIATIMFSVINSFISVSARWTK